MEFIARTPEPPYYAVVFTSVRSLGDQGYAKAAADILEVARRQPGFLGYEAARHEQTGISVSYWTSLESIAAWRAHPSHRAVQAGAAYWYTDSCIRICKVERAY